MAAHLAGVLAAETTLPVIGVPMPGSHLKGLDSLLSTVQMPAGVPVATMAIGAAGAQTPPSLPPKSWLSVTRGSKSASSATKKSWRRRWPSRRTDPGRLSPWLMITG